MAPGPHQSCLEGPGVRAVGPTTCCCLSTTSLAQPCRVCLLGSTLGVPTPSPWAWPRARTHHASVGDTQVLGLPWHAAALHGSPPRGAPTMGTAGSSGQSLHDDGQMTERTQVCSCGPSHPETPAHYLFSLPQEVSL